MAAVALNCLTWCKIHMSLLVTPAISAGVTTRLMDMSDWSPCSSNTESENAA